MTEYYDVGKIVNTHGLKGEVRVMSITSHPEERYAKGSLLVWFGEKGAREDLEVKSHRVHKNFDLLTFKDRPSINDVEHLVGGMLKVSEDNLLDELAENEYYHHEIVGLEVVDEEGNLIGKIKEILATGANDVWVVGRKGQKDLLLPYIDSVILEVNLEAGKVTVHVMEGLDD